MRDNRHEIMQANVRETRRQWLWTAGLVLALIVIALFRARQSGGRITAAVNDTQLGVAGYAHESVFVALSDIDSIELVPTEKLDIGEQKSVQEDSPNLYEGVYGSDTYGELKAIIGPKSSDVIVVSYTENGEDKVLIFSGLSDKDTAHLYKELTEKTEEKNE